MKTFSSSLALGLTALSLPFALGAAPTSGAYVTDAQNTWVQDRVGDRIGTVNMIMCIMSALRPDAMVNQGAYRALVDQNKCAGRGDAAKSGSTNAGEANATNFMAAVVQSTQASSTAPLVMKAWISEESEPGQKMTIYVYSEATAGKSASNPNGLFTITYCGKPVGVSDNTCVFGGVLRSDANGLSFYESEQGGGGGGGGGGTQETRLALQTSGTDGGQGRIQSMEQGAPAQHTFAYNADHFRRSDGSVDACFSRDKEVADYSTWRYGTYNEDGSRLDMTNPGFPVKYVNGGESYFGFWSFWGLWLPDAALATLGNSGELTRRVGNEDQALSVVKRGGKLWKQVRQQSTLGAFKSVSMMYWASNDVGPLQRGTNYELQWNGEKLLAIGTQSCTPNGCAPQPLTPPVEVSAATLRQGQVRMLPMFFPSGGGQGVVSVPASGEFSATTVLAYRTRSIVAPGASDAPSALVCLGNCLKADLAAAFQSQPPQPFDLQSWQPVLATAATTYAYGNGMLSRGGVAVNGSTLSREALGPFGGGVNTGSLVASGDLAPLRCDANGAANTAGLYLCPHLNDNAEVTYQWETGPNQWNQYFGAVGITIDPPKPLSFAPTLENIRAADKTKFAGTTVPLQFSGFGELQGIPGHCVDPNSNEAVPCGQNVRWVPAFDIVDGAAVTGGSTTHYVKYLERELRLGKLNGAADTSCKAALSLAGAAAMTLPDASSITINPITANGAEPTPSSPKPAVIDGIVQP